LRSPRHFQSRIRAIRNRSPSFIPGGLKCKTTKDATSPISFTLACDIGTSREYGRIKNLLHKTGHPIPENDIWIAALAMEHGLTLVSRDEHFKKVDELKRVAW
jgi:predicted nucleic acid-binding protein